MAELPPVMAFQMKEADGRTDRRDTARAVSGLMFRRDNGRRGTVRMDGGSGDEWQPDERRGKLSR